MTRINKPIARVALDHTFIFSFNIGLLIVAWSTFLFRSFVVGVLCGVGAFIASLLCWIPKYGPLRKYVERHYDDPR